MIIINLRTIGFAGTLTLLYYSRKLKQKLCIIFKIFLEEPNQIKLIWPYQNLM